ncbi:hypothetical protein BDV95DRAFT_600943 [Massariosphaeria phaeospora]|uniref:Uncharacterized protein n=1 Tax=Massariosphaeria phaeospora TaxID=100035 RepID=A0A7C8MH99_9PLEO|nr:hypothetical protein BDV95DRAFT_600943 [Massariosphaeria phaeospora]
MSNVHGTMSNPDRSLHLHEHSAYELFAIITVAFVCAHILSYYTIKLAKPVINSTIRFSKRVVNFTLRYAVKFPGFAVRCMEALLITCLCVLARLVVVSAALVITIVDWYSHFVEGVRLNLGKAEQTLSNTLERWARQIRPEEIEEMAQQY